ncbi:glycine cleavage system protein GcvH [Haliangium ochraceum]|uniref:Glycine cleavage system H protein n=1 Tax=Haliangium ochraceum (strain DSM 14365 / JCM 11303 / SMP-2) TaxID=502025 RepID=D0LTV6_HALO1|nr:glycine cleavage system protein GcvH [Haliangium ochraceum]ACY15800.1 glycine cleavage system H protein [Haliangium ochraceum DSM 14365]
MSYPKDLKYTKEHEWVRVEGDVATVGITDFAVKQLGDIVALDMPEEGDKIAVGDSLGSIESVKAVADLYAPVSGTVAAINQTLNDSPEYVNDDPHDEGWIVQITMSEAAELDELMDAEAYAAFVLEEEG